MTTTDITLRPFTSDDWECWSGCETAVPLVADDLEFDGERGSLIVDGATVQFDGLNGGGFIVKFQSYALAVAWSQSYCEVGGFGFDGVSV